MPVGGYRVWTPRCGNRFYTDQHARDHERKPANSTPGPTSRPNPKPSGCAARPTNTVQSPSGTGGPASAPTAPSCYPSRPSASTGTADERPFPDGTVGPRDQRRNQPHPARPSSPRWPACSPAPRPTSDPALTKARYLRTSAVTESKPYFWLVWGLVAFGILILVLGLDQPLVLLVISACTADTMTCAAPSSSSPAWPSASSPSSPSGNSSPNCSDFRSGSRRDDVDPSERDVCVLGGSVELV